MKRIAYYISDYGYGHATRSMAIINEILNHDTEVEVTVCHSYALPMLRVSFKEYPVKFRCIQTDIGYFLKENSLEPDIEKINIEFSRYMERWQNLVEDEIQFLHDKKIGLVLSDISPVAFEAADKVGVPSIGISNFTWYTAYQGLIDNKKLKPFKAAYDKMNYFFRLAGCNEPSWKSSKTIDVGFYSRDTVRAEVDRIRSELVPFEDKAIVFFGLGMKMDLGELSSLPLWDSHDCFFLTSSNTKVHHPNVVQIPDGYNDTQNYIAAADLVITKAGWGTVAEAAVSGTSLLIVDRQSMREDQNTINYIHKHRLGRTVNWEQLKTMKLDKEVIDSMKMSTNVVRENLSNEKEKMAKRILNILNS